MQKHLIGNPCWFDDSRDSPDRLSLFINVNRERRVCMGVNDVIFKWDVEKELINIDKHGISFSTATHMFFDDNRIENV